MDDLEATGQVEAGLYSNIIGRLDRNRKKAIKSLTAQECLVKEDMRELENEKFEILRKSDLNATKVAEKTGKSLESSAISVDAVKTQKRRHLLRAKKKSRYNNVQSNKRMTGISGDFGDISSKSDKSKHGELTISSNLTGRNTNIFSSFSGDDHENGLLDNSVASSDISEDAVNIVQNTKCFDESCNRVFPHNIKHRNKKASPPCTKANVLREITDAVQRIIAAKDRIILRKMNNEPYISELKKLTSCPNQIYRKNHGSRTSVRVQPNRRISWVRSEKSRISGIRSNSSASGKTYLSTVSSSSNSTKPSEFPHWYLSSDQIDPKCNRGKTSALKMADRVADGDSTEHVLGRNGAVTDNTNFDQRASSVSPIYSLNAYRSDTLRRRDSEALVPCIENELSEVEKTMLRLYHRAFNTGHRRDTEKVLSYFLNGWVMAPEHTRALAMFLGKTGSVEFHDQTYESLQRIVAASRNRLGRGELLLKDGVNRTVSAMAKDGPTGPWESQRDRKFFRQLVLRSLSEVASRCGVDSHPVTLFTYRYPGIAAQAGDVVLRTLCTSAGVPNGRVAPRSLSAYNGDLSKSVISDAIASARAGGSVAESRTLEKPTPERPLSLGDTHSSHVSFSSFYAAPHPEKDTKISTDSDDECNIDAQVAATRLNDETSRNSVHTDIREPRDYRVRRDAVGSVLDVSDTCSISNMAANWPNDVSRMIESN